MLRIITLVAYLAATTQLPAAERLALEIPSSVDGSKQKCYLNLPLGFDPKGKQRPLLVSLHSWSGDVEQRNVPLESGADERGWFCLQPNFRGRNDHPEALGSAIAQQDILDAVEYVAKNYPVDRRRVYLTGSSGGGHMTMLMAGRHPQVWAAASAWVGISNVRAWHERHASDNYGAMMRASCGGAPGTSAAVDNEYRQRSPLAHIAAAKDLPLDLAAGVHDGHQGSVPIRHTLDAFNLVAKARGDAIVSESEIEQLSEYQGRLTQPQPGDTVIDPSFDRVIYLRRHAGRCRVTIFEGGHEGLALAALEFLGRHVKEEGGK